jgi:hypothetical protein
MTCIIGIEAIDKNYNNVVVMAGDMLASNGHTKQLLTQSKVFKHSGIIFGYTSSFRFGQLIELCLNNNKLIPPTSKNDSYKWLVSAFVPELQHIFQEQKYNESGFCLIGLNGKIWKLQSDFSIVQSELGYDSVGTDMFSIPAIHTYYSLMFKNKKPTVSDVKLMLPVIFNAVSNYSCSVSKEFKVLTL